MLKTSALLVVVLFCAACPKQTNDDKKNPPTEQTPAKTEPVLTCEADDDCELYAFVAESGSDRFCCDTCGGDVANSDWIQSKVDACETRRKAKTADCPVIRCTQLNLVARCVDKVCKAVTPSAKPTFPPKDLTCKTDDDCTLSTRGHDGDYCCSKCIRSCAYASIRSYGGCSNR